MIKGFRRAGILALTLLLLLPFFPGIRALGTTDSSIPRIAGSNRYATAVAVSENSWSQADTAVLASGVNFPDALAGVPLAYQAKGPILLTGASSAPASTLSELQRLKVREVVLLGGTASVSETVENQLRSLGYQVRRIGGRNRYETATRIGAEIHAQQGKDTVILASGANFPDALSVSAHAARRGYPVLFSAASTLSAHTETALKDWGIRNVIIVGGDAAIGSSVESRIKSMGINTLRLSGRNRYDTALTVAAHFDGGYDGVYIATGENFPDALAGGVLAAKTNAPIVLSRQSALTPDSLSFAKGYPADTIRILGGEAAVGSGVVQSLLPEFSVAGIVMGDAASRVTSVLGTPDRQDVTEFGYTWHVYNKNLSNFVQVGIADGRVVALLTNADNWSGKAGIRSGSSVEDLRKAYAVEVTRNGDRAFLQMHGMNITFHHDTVEGPKVAAIQLVDSAYTAVRSYPSLTTLVERQERQILDLANVVRHQEGVAPLAWCSKAGKAAQNHSKDMAANSYFSHTSLDGRSLGDRLQEVGVTYRSASENIAYGQQSPLDVHIAWMNSPGHRTNLLRTTTYLGVGVALIPDSTSKPTRIVHRYYTQNFYTPR